LLPMGISLSVTVRPPIKLVRERLERVTKCVGLIEVIFGCIHEIYIAIAFTVVYNLAPPDRIPEEIHADKKRDTRRGVHPDEPSAGCRSMFSYIGVYPPKLAEALSS
jgi:hypothetical protein